MDFQVSNQEIRFKLIENYVSSLNDKVDSQLAIAQDLDLKSKQNLEKNFESYLLNLQFSFYDNDDENLIEIWIRYAITYLEEYDYDKKTHGLSLLDNLMLNVTQTKLLFNMRSDLIYNTFQRYLNDKDSVEFLNSITHSMRILLNIIESKYSSSEHRFKKHSLVYDSLLNNCYMSSSAQVKIVYYKNLKEFIKQMGDYTCRHLEKSLTVVFDCIESSKFGFDFEKQSNLVENAFSLLECLIQTCSLRIHAHSRRVVNFLLKIIYFYSLSLSLENSNNLEDSNLNNLSCRETSLPKLVEKVLSMLKYILVENNKTKLLFLDEFNDLKHKTLNKNFLKLIETIY